MIIDMRTNKYGNKRVKASLATDGYTFDSKAEYKMYCDLRLMQNSRTPLISGLEVHPKFVIYPAYTNAAGKRVNQIVYEADFSFYDIKQKRIRIIDCKGKRTDVFELKEKMFNREYRKLGYVLEYTI